MTVRNLEFLFRPRSVAVIAESDEASCYAEVVLRNLAADGFAGPVLSVAARKRSLFGIGPRIHIDKLEEVPDLAIVCAALGDVPQIITQLGALGTRAVIVGPSRRGKMSGNEVTQARKAILDAARPYLIRVLGPGSSGLAVPALGLNASIAPVAIRPGKIALVAQSAAVAAAVLDRARSKGIGFSSVLHLGASADVDLADVLDWLAADPDTGSILVQFETVTSGRKFMSAARAAARNKPVVAIRGGEVAARPETPEAFSADDVYAAALRRAGWVCIDTLEDLFDAAEALARVRPLQGERLSIIANGHGLGRIAANALQRADGRAAALSAATAKQLKELLGMHWPLGNPLVLPGEITAANWGAVLAALLADGNTDAVLTVYSPSPFAPGVEVAKAICAVARDSPINVFTCWVGGNAMLEAQAVVAAQGVLSLDSPEKAIAIFRGIVNYRRNRDMLVQMPPSLAEDFAPDLVAARDAIDEALDAGTAFLTPRQAQRLLQAYGIDALEHPLLGSIEAAIRSAAEIGYPVDLTLVLFNTPEQEAPALGLRSPTDIHIAARGLRSSARARHPGCRVSGYRLRPSGPRSATPALRLGVADDAVFGPVIYLGPAVAGGPRDKGCVAGLPPLNRVLAEDLVARSGFAADAPAQQAALGRTLVRLSQLLADIDEIAGLELDPLHIETAGVLVQGTRIGIEKSGRRRGLRRFAIRPYPKELEQRLEWQGRRILIRPIRPEDETALGDLIASLEVEDSRMRFFGAMRSLPRSQLARFTQIDYDREMALVAIERGSDGVERSLGEVRTVADPDNRVAEFAILVRSELKGLGLGRLLLRSMIDYSRSRGTAELRGETLAGNLRMQRLAEDLGFQVKTGTDLGSLDLILPLRRPPD